jgi:hypothetical protein
MGCDVTIEYQVKYRRGIEALDRWESEINEIIIGTCRGCMNLWLSYDHWSRHRGVKHPTYEAELQVGFYFTINHHTS